MKLNYALLTDIIIFEIAIVGLIVVLAYVYKFYYTNKENWLRLLAVEVRQYLDDILLSKIEFDESSFRTSWKRMDVLLPIVLEYNNKVTSPLWEPTRNQLLSTIMLPMARAATTDSDWLMRVFAAQTFQLDTNPEDDKYIIKLLEDKIPLIHLHAAVAAIMDGGKPAILRLIEIMANYNHYSHSMYLQLFDKELTYIPDYVKEFLPTQTDLNIRWVCYEILLKYPPSGMLDYINDDIKAENTDLQISALKYYKYLLGEKAAPLLIEQLSNEKWEIRVICLHLLASLKMPSAIPHIEKCLHDRVWWVRTSAAQSLKQFGEKGLEILNAQDPKKDAYAYDAAMHALNKPPPPEKK